jgi:hypothetical protein
MKIRNKVYLVGLATWNVCSPYDEIRYRSWTEWSFAARTFSFCPSAESVVTFFSQVSPARLLIKVFNFLIKERWSCIALTVFSAIQRQRELWQKSNISAFWTTLLLGAREVTTLHPFPDTKYFKVFSHLPRFNRACVGMCIKTNTQIAKELKITPILEKILEYKRN